MANDIVVKNDANIALAKSKKLFDITNKILGIRDKNKVVEVKKSSEVLAHKISDDQNRPIEFEDNILAWIDKDTGLMWEVKTRENIKYCYVWDNEYIKDARYPEKLTDNIKDTFSYAEKLNKMNYGGFSDWRIPTIEELDTLLTKEDNSNKYIKRPLVKNTLINYWAIPSITLEDDYSWYINFSGAYSANGAKNNAYYIRCVRLF